MAPVVYYLNKIYQASTNDSSSNINGNNVNKNAFNERSKSRNNEPIGSFYWLRTGPGAILIICIVFGSASSFYDVFSNALPPSWFYTMADPDSKAIYFGEHLMKIWTHLAVFAIGIIAGVECRRATGNVISGGFRGGNLDLMSQHNDGLKSNKAHLSTSSSSLPTVTQDGDSLFPKSRNNTDTTMNNSSVSIDIQTNSSSHENINGSENGIVTNNNNSINTSKGKNLLVDLFGSIVAIIVMATIIFSTHDWSLNDLPKPWVAGLFDVSSRILWSLAFTWMLYMVSVPKKDGNFSIVARALGHPIMVSLGKLSFLVYILHPVIHTTVLAIQEQPIYSSWLMLIHILIGNITITVILASLVSLFVEMPCRNLFRRCETSLLLTHTVDTTTVLR